MYCGSTRFRQELHYISSVDFEITQKVIDTCPAIIRIFLEVLSNATDNVERSKRTGINCTKIKVYINFIDGEFLYITILNDTVKTTLNNSLNSNIFLQNISIEPESNKFLKFDDENCGIDSKEQQKKNSITNNLDPVGETPNLVKYRIAVIPSSEWSNYFINEYNAQDLDNSKKRSIVLGEIGVTLAEINSIYERDLGVTFELIENNELKSSWKKVQNAQLKPDGYIFNVIHSALYFITENKTLNDAIKFSGKANYCSVLVGAIMACLKK